MMFVLSCIHVNHLCILYLYYFLVVVHRGPHGRLAFFLLNVLPSENKDYYYYLLLLYSEELTRTVRMLGLPHGGASSAILTCSP